MLKIIKNIENKRNEYLEELLKLAPIVEAYGRISNTDYDYMSFRSIDEEDMGEVSFSSRGVIIEYEVYAGCNEYDQKDFFIPIEFIEKYEAGELEEYERKIEQERLDKQHKAELIKEKNERLQEITKKLNAMKTLDMDGTEGYKILFEEENSLRKEVYELKNKKGN